MGACTLCSLSKKQISCSLDSEEYNLMQSMLPKVLELVVCVHICMCMYVACMYVLLHKHTLDPRHKSSF